MDVARKVRPRLPRRPERTPDLPCEGCQLSPAVQPLHQPAVRARVPHPGHLSDGRRHHRHGLPSLHRLPFLHGRLSLRRPLLQLCGSPQVPERSRAEPRLPHPHDRCGLAVGQMPACVEAAGGRILFGDLNDPKSDVCKALASNYSIRRKPNLGTQPGVYYLI